MSTTTLLLIDDSESSRLMVDFLIRLYNTEKYQVIGVDTMALAKEFIAREVPKLVLLDLQLPDSNVDESIAQIPEIVKSVPVVVVSCHDDIEIQDRCKKAGASHFVDKSWLTLEHKDKLKEIIDFYIP